MNFFCRISHARWLSHPENCSNNFASSWTKRLSCKNPIFPDFLPPFTNSLRSIWCKLSFIGWLAIVKSFLFLLHVPRSLLMVWMFSITRLLNYEKDIRRKRKAICLLNSPIIRIKYLPLPLGCEEAPNSRKWVLLFNS